MILFNCSEHLFLKQILLLKGLVNLKKKKNLSTLISLNMCMYVWFLASEDY